ncbi:G2/mitotic-specific cyclin-B-like [Ylistrum balloti]|uniref:G2/mitotic-specific cyclin-B-like n=1 Tax=Ylistrum balloti TaxID=509963 RepID=UPI002905884B|nr:G2/mitotic-specific cyclin-B-like [Ylistrum balloti]
MDQKVTNAPKKVHKKVVTTSDRARENIDGMEYSPSQCMEAPVRCCRGLAHQENPYILRGKTNSGDKTKEKVLGLKVRNIHHQNKINGETVEVLPSVYIAKMMREKSHKATKIPLILTGSGHTPSTEASKKLKKGHHHHQHHAHGHHGHHHGHHGEFGSLGMLKKHHKFHVINPEPSAIMDDDLLFMDVDCDPLMKIREIQTRVPMGVEDIDISHTSDPLCVPEYAQEIYHYLQSVENRHTLPDDFLHNNPKVTAHMHAILTDWLIQVQVHQQMCQQTLHLTVALIDQILNRVKISLAVLQLLGITCVLIAAKYVERFPPEITSLCNLTDNTYEPQQVLDMEKFILKELKFDLNICEPIMFLERFLEVENEDKEVEHLAQYLLDLSLTSVHFTMYVPSKMAASALLMSRKILGRKGWTTGLGYYTMYAEKDLTKCGNALCRLLLRINNAKYQGAKNKYTSHSCFGAISDHPRVTDKDHLKKICCLETEIL